MGVVHPLERRDKDLHHLGDEREDEEDDEEDHRVKAKSEIRNPKLETITEARNSNEAVSFKTFRHSSFGFVSDLELRISGFFIFFLSLRTRLPASTNPPPARPAPGHP